MAKGKKTGGRQKGSGNKKTALERQLAKDFAMPLVPLAFKKLEKILLTSKSNTELMQAAEIVLNRAFGLPNQSITQKGAIAPGSDRPTDAQVQNYLYNCKRVAAKFS